MSTQSDFLGAMQDAHRDLFEELSLLEQSLDFSDQQIPTELRQRMENVVSLVTCHFALEEEGGYLIAVRERRPEMAQRIDQLKAQHETLSETIRELMSSEITRDPSLVRQSLQAWIQNMREHERLENELVLTAFNSDLGTGD